MIELNYLNDFPKMFTKESLQLKHLFNIYNETKAEITYVKSIIEIESKSQESQSKSTLGITKESANVNSGPYISAILPTEDLTNLLKLSQVFLQMFDQISQETLHSTNLNAVNKAFSEISDDITDFTKGSFENITVLIKDLNNARSRYKSQLQKTEKGYRELEQNYQNKKKIENDDKHSYNQTMKDKIDERILNLLNEFAENKQILTQTFDECKRLEVVLNELIKNNLVNSIKFLFNSTSRFKLCLSEINQSKTYTVNKVKNEIVENITKSINEIEFDFERQEERYNELKGIKNDFGYILPMFGSNSAMTTNTSSDAASYSSQAQELHLEDYFNKTNYNVSTFTDNFLSFIFSFQQSLALRKKHLAGFCKSISEIIKINENFTTMASKLIKNLASPKVTILTNCPFLIQMAEFLRSFFELVLRKEEEFTKLLYTNITNPIDHFLLKDINSDEVIINQVFSKIQKEYNNFKTSLHKLQQNKEKVTQSIEKVKENIHKNPDDVNNFAKYEKQFLSLRAEEGNINEACVDVYKKYRKIIDECIDIVKKTVISYREKEVSKTRDLKDTLIATLKQKEKNLIHISEFLEYSKQINFDESFIFNAVKTVYMNFINDFDLGLQDNLLTDLLNEVINIGNNDYTIKKEIQTILKDIIFINKEEILQGKEFVLNDIINEEEVKSYKDKLNFLNNSGKKISIKNVNINRKMYDDVFYIDEDESVVSSYSCALSDKILVQGKLYITNKKFVFYSWFNNSTLFGKTLIEIPKDDITDVKPHKNMLFDNMIYVTTKTTQFLFASLINRDKCYYLIREVLFGEPNPLSESMRKETVDANAAENMSSNILPLSPVKLKNDEEVPIADSEEEENKENEIDLHPMDSNYLAQHNLPTKLFNLNKTRLDSFNLQNKRNFQSVIIKSHKLGDIPLSHIYRSLYNPDSPCLELGKEKNFYMSYLDLRQDYAVTLSKIQEETWKEKIPKYISNNNNYIFSIFNSEANLINFLDTEIDSASETDYPKIEYKYNYTHPILKKKFMGPSKLEVEDVFKVYFVSPMCMIVEIFSYMSGFMMMDTFYSILQYKFETTYDIDGGRDGKKVSYDTQLTVSFGIEFIKDNWFKAKILGEAQADMDESIKTVMLPNITKVLDAEKLRYNDEFRRSGVRGDLIGEPPVEGEFPLEKSQEPLIVDNKHKVVDLTNEFNFVDKLKEKPEEKPEKNKNIIPIPPSAKENILNFNDFVNFFMSFNLKEEKYLYFTFTLSILLLLFLVFPFNLVSILSINLLGLYIIYNKIGQVEARLHNLEQSITKLNLR